MVLLRLVHMEISDWQSFSKWRIRHGKSGRWGKNVFLEVAEIKIKYDVKWNILMVYEYEGLYWFCRYLKIIFWVSNFWNEQVIIGELCKSVRFLFGLRWCLDILWIISRNKFKCYMCCSSTSIWDSCFSSLMSLAYLESFKRSYVVDLFFQFIEEKLWRYFFEHLSVGWVFEVFGVSLSEILAWFSWFRTISFIAVCICQIWIGFVCHC